MADEINMSMPDHVVDMTMRALNEDKKALNGSSILILGVAYKKDIDDFRESPALEIIHKLQKMGAIINYNDPFVPELDVHGNRTEILQSVDLNADTLSKFDVVVVTTDHSFYQSVAPDILNHSKKIIDTRNIFGSIKQTSNIVTVL
jgi:UDP-N-acetyl-D-glucosamine dehydrogenase